MRTRRLDNLYDVVKEFNELWNEVPKNVNSTELRASLDVSVHVLGGYLIALALMGRQEYVREILNVYSDLLGMSKPINVATRLTIKYLGMDVEVPSNKEVFEVIKDDVIPDLRPAMAEILGIPISDVQKECERYKFIDSKACVAAYNAVKGDKEAEEYVKQKITIGLSNSGIPSELLGRTSVRQLIEVIGLTSSFSHFILTLRALILGDKDLALLHAEVAHLITQALYDTAYDRALKWYFDELTDALKSNDDNSIKRAIAKLYYCHLWFGYPVITLSIRLPRRL